jgi:TetR/AcrR family fatty acid metabolism transcriptional regulator
VLAGVADPVERLRRIARVHLERVGRDRDLAIVTQVELRQSTKFMEQFSSTELREYLGVIRDVVADGQRRGLFRASLSPTLAAKFLFGALDEMATNWILSRRHYDLAADADAVVDLFLHGVKA